MEKQPRSLFVMLGFLGSGKSYVSRWLAQHIDAVSIRTDELRWQMFGPDRPELYLPENKALVNNAARYMASQILSSGMGHVILDGNNNSREVRTELQHLAQEAGAHAITVWVDTPLDVAKQRTIIRKETEGHVLFEENLVEKMAARLQVPARDELSIRIDGLLNAEQQKASFDEQFAQLQATKLQ